MVKDPSVEVMIVDFEKKTGEERYIPHP